MICYHNLGEIAHDVVTACLVRIGIKKRARCCDYWDIVNSLQFSKRPHQSPHLIHTCIILQQEDINDRLEILN